MGELASKNIEFSSVDPGNFGEVVRQARERQGLPIDRIMKEIGIPYAQVACAEKGIEPRTFKASPLSDEDKNKWANVLGLGPEDFILSQE